MDEQRAPVIGVIGGSGGVGASTFAAVLAAVAEGLSVLVDLDPIAGGVDVLLGVESVPGARWSGLRVNGGRLAPDLLADGLPRWSSVAVLAADVAPPPAAVGQVLDVAACIGPVVAELPRWPSAERAAALGRCRLVVLVAGADVRSISGARSVVSGLASAPPPVGAVVRTRRGLQPAQRVADFLGLPLIGSAPASAPRTDRPLDPSALPPGLVRVARGVLEGLAAGDV